MVGLVALASPSYHLHVRLRTLRGKACDTSWRRLRLTGNGEVELGRERDKLSELGIRGWIKGEK